MTNHDNANIICIKIITAYKNKSPKHNFYESNKLIGINDVFIKISVFFYEIVFDNMVIT